MGQQKFPRMGSCPGTVRSLSIAPSEWTSLERLPREETSIVRVLVVDDHMAFRKALTSALSMVRDIEVAGEAGGGLEGTHRALAVEPDLVIMDLSMPDLDGIEAMRRIHEQKPDLPVVILTAHADPGVEREAREAGASGFLAKGTALEDIVLVLHEAAPKT
jgi:DNA-binding NarL/FixJ family response regulator